MHYTMKSGALLAEDGRPAARIAADPMNTARTVTVDGSNVSFRTRIQNSAAGTEHSGDARFHTYLLENQQGQVLMQAVPVYDQQDDPDKQGWPVCRMPGIDHAQLTLEGGQYLLTMADRQHYTLTDAQGTAMQLRHRELCGGWDLEDFRQLPAQILCGIFLFCRYLEQEIAFPCL